MLASSTRFRPSGRHQTASGEHEPTAPPAGLARGLSAVATPPSPRRTRSPKTEPSPIDPPSRIIVDSLRNLCVLAHVDHGKTTLSDHLVATAGLIHPKNVGALRYLDATAEEQARGITIEASSIALRYLPGSAAGRFEPRGEAGPEGDAAGAAGSAGAAAASSSAPSSAAPSSAAGAPSTFLTPGRALLHRATRSERLERGYLINLVDSPGHVDFCGEVSCAARLSDGALVLVDAVEGVCVQTHAVLRRAWEERLGLILVINKVDRLRTELGLDPEEAAGRLRATVEQCNHLVSQLESEAFLGSLDAGWEGGAWANEGGAATGEGEDAAAGGGEAEPSGRDAFRPADGNVLFCSARDGWAFSLPQMAETWAPRMSGPSGAAPASASASASAPPPPASAVRPAALARAMWTDACWSAKDRRVVTAKVGAKRGLPTLLSALCVAPVWRVYDAGDGATSNDRAASLAALRRIRDATCPSLPDAALETVGPSGGDGGGGAWTPRGAGMRPRGRGRSYGRGCP